MIDINLENMKDVDVRIISSKCLIKLTTSKGAIIDILTDTEKATWLYEAIGEALENKLKVVV